VFFIDLFVVIFCLFDEEVFKRRGGRVAEGARLESVYILTGIGGSNPFLSAYNI
jgi:hypothetical protein